VKARIIARFLPDYHKLAQPGDKVVATNPGTGWGTPQWDVFRQKCFDMVDKGIDFTRIVIEPTAATPEEKKRLRQEMDRQKEKLKVGFIRESRLPQDVKQNSFLIYDRYFAYATYSKTLGTSIRHLVEETTFFTRREELDKAKALAETIIRLSEEYK